MSMQNRLNPLIFSAFICVILRPDVAIAQSAADDHVDRMKKGTALFQSRIGPALTRHCLRCHGDEKVRGDLDLSSRKLLLTGGESGPAVNLEHPAGSRLLQLIRHAEKPHMPAKKPKLPDALVAEFARWIELGAPYDKPLLEKNTNRSKEMKVTDSDRAYWAFAPLQVVEPPTTKDPWVKNDIDRFVLQRLNQNQLQPSPPASDTIRIRRSYLDVIGLPPTPVQMVSARQLSHVKLIDQLLDSPHFGERWGRHWLDAARFAESHGFEQDYNRAFAYHFRDFVIRAFNQDMPYDQFVRWQIAGDEFAPDNPLAMMATGFLGAGVFPTQLTEKEFERARYDEMDDMLSTTGNAMLGLTIGCARCHDHKFDPIPEKDYYQLLSSFTTTIRSEIDLALQPEDDETTRAAWQKQHEEQESARRRYEQSPKTARRFENWLRAQADEEIPRTPWLILNPHRRHANGGASLNLQPDGSILVTGNNPTSDHYELIAACPDHGARQLRIEALTHASLPRKGPGRAGNGNFALSDLKIQARPTGKADAKWAPVPLHNPRATHEQNKDNLSVASAIDKDAKSGWAVDFGGIGKDQAAVFTFTEPIAFAAGIELKINMNFASNGQHALGRFRVSVSPLTEVPVAVGSGRSALLDAAFAALKNNQLKPEQRRALFPMFAATDAEWNRLDAAVQASLARKPVSQKVKVQVSSEGLPHTKHHADGRGYPHFYPKTHYLKRGDPNQKNGVAEQGVLQVLMRNGKAFDHWRELPPDGNRTSYRRRSMANWMTDARDGAGHLLARVIVNRVWHHHFGRGIVSTPNDFGLQGSLPTHPELLDFLAQGLIDNGWHLKWLHREILGSATWQQSSAPVPAAAAIDPQNQWLWRFAPRRLEAEVLRDAMLTVSGQLDPTPFGPGTLNESMRRRSIYFMIKRSKLVPMMQVFDQPEPLVSQGSRPSTTIAPQALHFMNNPQVVKWAQALASQLVSTGNPDAGDAAIQSAYQRVLSRSASEAEMQRAIRFLEAQMTAYSGGRAQQLALADFCQVLFSLNEFVYLQ